MQYTLLDFRTFSADGLRPSVHQVPEDVAVVGVTDRVLQHRGGDPARCDLAQGQTERGADAAAHDMEPVEPEMVGQCQVIGSIDVPVIATVDPRARMPGIALIHRDDTILVAQHRHRVHPHRRRRGVRRAVAPECELRAQPAGCENHQRKAAAVHLVIDLAVR